MRNLHDSAAHIQGRRHDVVYAEPLHRTHDSHDVDDGVDGADFVEVNLIERDVVNGGLRLTQPSEQRDGARLARRRQCGLADEPRDVRQRPVAVGTMRVAVLVPVVVCVCLFVSAIVPVAVIVAVVRDAAHQTQLMPVGAGVVIVTVRRVAP